MAQDDPSKDRALSDIERAAMFQSPDDLLGAMIALAEGGLEIGLTLTVSGTLVSGIVISGKKYHELLAGLFQEGFAATAYPAGGDLLKEGLLERAESIYGQGRIHADDDPNRVRAYIHLRNVRMFVPGGEHYFDPQRPAGIAWRGRLASVNGWSLGNPFAAP